jgi:hypothetical protein
MTRDGCAAEGLPWPTGGKFSSVENMLLDDGEQQTQETIGEVAEIVK